MAMHMELFIGKEQFKILLQCAFEMETKEESGVMK
jgi:hypothetical protein